MTVTDEYDKLSRFDVMRKNLEKCEPLLKQLQDEQDVTFHIYGFSSNFNANAEQYKPLTEDKKPVSIADWLKSRKPDGKRTDFGLMLSELYKKYQGETNPFRGMIIVSDGGNNVSEPDPNVQATRWRGINCPIYTFMVGKTDTKPDQKDIGFTSVVVDPTPVPVKADLTAKATLKAAGLEGSAVKIKLTLKQAQCREATMGGDARTDAHRRFQAHEGGGQRNRNHHQGARQARASPRQARNHRRPARGSHPREQPNFDLRNRDEGGRPHPGDR